MEPAKAEVVLSVELRRNVLKTLVNRHQALAKDESSWGNVRTMEDRQISETVSRNEANTRASNMCSLMELQKAI